ncbi:MAG: hypothetical protein VX834_06315, partial [Myxococcota bacterium]|nr:hypothetical protein [Myxococcota bacterium]
LGQGYNIQAGYVADSGFSVDARFAALTPSFTQNTNSVLKETSAYAVALGHYFLEGSAKVQATWSSKAHGEEAENSGVEISLQLRF